MTDDELTAIAPETLDDWEKVLGHYSRNTGAEVFALRCISELRKRGALITELEAEVARLTHSEWGSP